jgi:hypothetical protein
MVLSMLKEGGGRVEWEREESEERKEREEREEREEKGGRRSRGGLKRRIKREGEEAGWRGGRRTPLTPLQDGLQGVPHLRFPLLWHHLLHW